MNALSETIPFSAADIDATRAPLGQAAPLPPSSYTSESLYNLEQARVFRSEWLCVGRVDQISEPGSFISLDLLGEPLMIVRGDDDEVRILSRVCRHRAAEVVRGSGKTRAFRCPYHAWTYRLDGSLHAAPMMEDATAFDPAICRLHQFASEIWEGWVFVNLDGSAAPLGPRLEPLSDTLKNYRMSEMVAMAPIEFDSPFNWKLLVENFMEAYHHIAIHSTTFEPVFPAAKSHVGENFGPYSVLEMLAKEGVDLGAGLNELPRHGPLTEQESSRLIAAAVFPFHLFAPGAESLIWYQLLPESYDRFTLRIYPCLPQSTLEDPAYADAIAGLRDFVESIHHEDIAACEATWRGVQAPSAKPGHLSMLERSIWQFNQWWLERMAT